MKRPNKRPKHLPDHLRETAIILHHAMKPHLLAALDPEAGERVFGGTSAHPAMNLVTGKGHDPIPLVDDMSDNPYGASALEKALDALLVARVRRAGGVGTHRLIAGALDAELLGAMPFDDMASLMTDERYAIFQSRGATPSILRNLPKTTYARVQKKDLTGMAWAKIQTESRPDERFPRIFVLAASLSDRVAYSRGANNLQEIRLAPGSIPHTMMVDLKGRALRDVVSHPILDRFEFEIAAVSIRPASIGLLVRDRSDGAWERCPLDHPRTREWTQAEARRVDALRELLIPLQQRLLPHPTPEKIKAMAAEHGVTALRDGERPVKPRSEFGSGRRSEPSDTPVAEDGPCVRQDILLDWPDMVEASGLDEDVLGDLTARDLGANPALSVERRGALMARALSGEDGRICRGARRHLIRMGMAIPDDPDPHLPDPAVMAVVEMISDARHSRRGQEQE